MAAVETRAAQARPGKKFTIQGKRHVRKKIFLNNNAYSMKVTLLVREGEWPENEAESQEFSLEADESRQEYYGDYRNIYLNGIPATAFSSL